MPPRDKQSGVWWEGQRGRGKNDGGGGLSVGKEEIMVRRIVHRLRRGVR